MRCLCLFPLLVLIGCGAAPRNDVDWNAIARDEYRVEFVALNYDGFPTEETAGESILDRADEGKRVVLTAAQREALRAFVSDASNFHEAADCGTFHLNGGFVISRGDEISGSIDVGCGYNQWNFKSTKQPNPNAGGSLTERGFERMTVLMDEINRPPTSGNQ